MGFRRRAGAMLGNEYVEAVPLCGYTGIEMASKDASVLKGTYGAKNPGSFSLTEQEDEKRQKQIMELYDSHSSSLYKYLRTLGLVRDEAEDVIQEAFLRLASHLLEGGADSNLRSWIFQVAHNLSMDKHRGRRRSKTSNEAVDEITVEPTDPAADPEQIYLHKETIQRVNSAMTRLTPQQRNGVLLRAQGLRYMEIASVLGVSESRAIHLVKRGLMRLTGGL